MSKVVVSVVKVADIRENPVALRAVDRESEKFIGLRDSVASVGLLNPFSVRKREENIDGKITAYYELIDGLHRYSAALDVGLVEVPVLVKDISDVEVYEAQIMANVHKAETRAVEYTKQLNRVLSVNPTMTIADLAARLAKSGAWVSSRLGLLKLADPIAKMVDDGKIKVSNAIALAKLPQGEQPHFVDQAITMGVEEFIPTINARAKELRDAARAGKRAAPAEFIPIARVQKMSELKNELENPTIGPELIRSCKVKTAIDGFALGVAWVLNLDPNSVEVQRTKAEAKKQAVNELKKKRAADRAATKAEEAKQAAAEAAAAVA